ncbi:glycoside hydrolase family 15 protein [Legionella spiritensis]|uniref:glucan 1,4-alpha-glucosidase n=1 Tax=Legionella spiritensis TaxID=452 RepID=A0A0W0Z6W9_LEGSP|nr:glycoside hydrolase family 15 protein [Legionella spiritensis]KTD64861.1 glucoamylase [Legionella spiritensis]SNV40948.1 glucoamylase [Legionella spiritensis]
MKRILTLLLYIFLPGAFAGVFSPDDVATFKKHFIANITGDGAIMASPSTAHPDYYYDWVRDSAIAMSLIETWYENNPNEQDKEKLLHYVQWVERTQHQQETLPGYDILGEPKFYLNGLPYQEPWGRPQNDGPALRALTLIRFARVLLDNQGSEYVREHLYGGSLDPLRMGVIKMDLEYTAHHWQDKNFDLWEEVYGHHFFTAMAQRKALLEGAKLARRMQDNQAAAYYELQARLLGQRLNQHIDSRNGLIQATLPPHSGPIKTLELDSAVLLAVLLVNNNDGMFAPDNTSVIKTAAALKKQFQSLFPINRNHHKAVLFGRYPGDTYDGYSSDSTGNPWFILTAAMAEYYYTLADSLPPTRKNMPLIKQHIEEGDNYLNLVKQYAGDRTLSEQINLETGVQQGARSLTWSYVAVLRAIAMQEKLSKKAESMPR